MRVLHLITRLILGGAQENTLLSCVGQRDLGHEVRLVTGPTTGPEGTLVPEALAAGLDLVEVPSLLRAVSPVADLRAWAALRREIRRFDPDVVHTHSSKAGVLGRSAAWSLKAGSRPAVVHTIHGLPFHPFQSRIAHLVYRQAERWAAARCDRIVSVADAMTAQAVAAGVARPEKFVTVYSGMRIEPFLRERTDTERRARWGLRPGDTVIGKVARLFELKGHEYLFEAFRRLAPARPALRLLLIGDGLLRADFERRAREAGLEGRVIFTGLVPREEVADAIAACDLIAHCSLREGLARVLPQALLAARPVVAFDVDGAREVVRDGETGLLVRAEDTDGLTDAIARLLDRPDEARRMAAAGRELCRGRFDWREMVRRLDEVYRGAGGGGA